MNPVRGVLFWVFVGVCGILTWIGTCPVEEPFITIGQFFTVFYFLYYVVMPWALYYR